MPTTFLKNLAQEKGITVKKAEDFWEQAKEMALESYKEDSPSYWGTVTNITKNLVNKYIYDNKKKAFKIIILE